MIGELFIQIQIGFPRGIRREGERVKISRVFQSETGVEVLIYFHLGSICQGWNWSEQHEFRTSFARRIDQAKSNSGLGPLKIATKNSLFRHKLKTLFQIHPNLSTTNRLTVIPPRRLDPSSHVSPLIFVQLFRKIPSSRSSSRLSHTR